MNVSMNFNLPQDEDKYYFAQHGQEYAYILNDIITDLEYEAIKDEDRCIKAFDMINKINDWIHLRRLRRPE